MMIFFISPSLTTGIQGSRTSSLGPPLRGGASHQLWGTEQALPRPWTEVWMAGHLR